MEKRPNPKQIRINPDLYEKALVEAKKAGPKFSDSAAWAVPSNPTWANARALVVSLKLTKATMSWHKF
jgi:hypothetical protein